MIRAFNPDLQISGLIRIRNNSVYVRTASLRKAPALRWCLMKVTNPLTSSLDGRGLPVNRITEDIFGNETETEMAVKMEA